MSLERFNDQTLYEATKHRGARIRAICAEAAVGFLQYFSIDARFQNLRRDEGGFVGSNACRILAKYIRHSQRVCAITPSISPGIYSQLRVVARSHNATCCARCIPLRRSGSMHFGVSEPKRCAAPVAPRIW